MPLTVKSIETQIREQIDRYDALAEKYKSEDENKIHPEYSWICKSMSLRELLLWIQQEHINDMTAAKIAEQNKKK